MSQLSSLAPAPEMGQDGRSGFREHPRDLTHAAGEPEAQPADDPGQRLIIEEGEEGGPFVYTVIDRASGEVVSRIAQDELARMGERPDYAAGALIRAKA